MSGKKIWILLVTLLGLGAVAALCCGGAVFLGFRVYEGIREASTEAPLAIDTLFAAVESDEVRQWYEAHTTEDFKANSTADEMEALFRGIHERLGDLKSRQLTGCQIKSVNGRTFAEVSLNTTFTNGKGVIRANLEKQGSQWKWAGFNFSSPQLLPKTVTAVEKTSSSPAAVE